ncbi:hypothetical protein GCM10009655_19930 [Rhodoglobus aureus]|uniref:Uncharacterized protein n=1 Tax=Rhodoglobus aureus TaxID=191497 RepID=A0ABP4GDM9_9MICO
MVLDARANNQLFGFSNLPKSFARDQVLKLEGDFNEHFTLYSPRHYERDALYVFTQHPMTSTLSTNGCWFTHLKNST